MKELLERISARSALEVAWAEVLNNDREDGELSRSGERFLDNADQELSRLSEQLRDGSFRWSPLTPVKIPKSSGDVRLLEIPVVRDRVVERSIARHLDPHIDPFLSPGSFAYRPGLGTVDAVRRIIEERDDGARFVVRADVDDCFPSLSHVEIERSLALLVSSESVLDLLRSLLKRNIRGSNVPRIRGISQGSPLSPLLSNLAMRVLDLAAVRRGLILVRYADDLCIPVASREDAERALNDLRREVEALGATLGEDKTEIVSFDEGFVFVGEEFSSKYPTSAELQRSSEPTKRTLLVSMEGSVVRSQRGQIVVSKNDEDLLSVPMTSVGRIVLFGSIGLSAGARSFAMGSGIPVVMCSRRGGYLGSLVSSTGRRMSMLRRQLKTTTEPAWRLSMASRFVFGKLANQRALLQRYSRGRPQDVLVDAVDDLEKRMLQVADCTSIDELMGVEGAGAATYWRAFSSLLPSWCAFEGRRHSPPPDGTNALLSFGYTILTSECVSALHAVGLEPAVGVLHAEGDDKPSLALDSMEEFRPLIIDSVVLNVLRRRRVTAESFRSEPGRKSVLLTKEGRTSFLSAIEERFLQIGWSPSTGKKVSYRRALYLQAQAIARAVDSGEVAYEPMRWRL